MEKFENIKEPLERALRVIIEDRSAFKLVRNPNKVINAEKIEQAAGNHLFDDYYQTLKISQNEAHKIRSYFQTTAHENGSEYVSNLHEAFPNIMEKEDPRFLTKINKERVFQGLEQINY